MLAISNSLKLPIVLIPDCNNGWKHFVMQLLGPDDKWPIVRRKGGKGRGRISYPNCRIPSKTKMFRDQAIFSLETEEVV